MRDMLMVLGRLLMSAIFIQSGISGLIQLGGTAGYFGSLGVPLPWVTVWIVLAIQLAGGLALLLGYRIRLASLVLGLFSIAAALIGHSSWSQPAELQLFMKDIALAGGLFYFLAHGAGLISFDARREA